MTTKERQLACRCRNAVIRNRWRGGLNGATWWGLIGREAWLLFSRSGNAVYAARFSSLYARSLHVTRCFFVRVDRCARRGRVRWSLRGVPVRKHSEKGTWL